MSGITLARPLQLQDKPVTRVENYCATGSEALRQAVYAVASGAYDVAMAVGAEKTKDSGFQGLNAAPPPNDGTGRTLTAAAMFSMAAPAYANKFGVEFDDVREAMARIAWKNHVNGARNSRAQFRKEVSLDTIKNSPKMAGSLGVFDCAGVADGGRSRDRVPRRGRPQVHRHAAVREGAQLRGRQRLGAHRPHVRLHDVPRIVATAKDAYAQAGVTDPRGQWRWPRCTTASRSHGTDPDGGPRSPSGARHA